jgi:hypothetical protein
MKLTKKLLNKKYPDFKVGGTHGRYHITHLPSGKESVCIISLLRLVEEIIKGVIVDDKFFVNPLDNKSYFRHVNPTHESPFNKGDVVRVVATNDEIYGFFGHNRFCDKGEVLTVNDIHWDSIMEEWYPSFDSSDEYGGFNLMPSMFKPVNIL